MRILFVGDVVAHPGKRIVKNKLKELISDQHIDACVVNAENVAAGMGINYNSAKDIFACGADCITLGNHSFSCPDFFRFADMEQRIVRPANVSSEWPGFGEYLIDLKEKGRLLVVNLLGQVFMAPSADSPFKYLDDHIAEWKEKYAPTNILIDMHAEASSEKMAIGYYADGRVSLVLGTHTHVQTADEKILPCGTGYITDVGMTGAMDSIIGMNVDASLRRLAKRLPTKYAPAEGPSSLHAIIAELDKNNGKCLKIERIKIDE